MELGVQLPGGGFADAILMLLPDELKEQVMGPQHTERWSATAVLVAQGLKTVCTWHVPLKEKTALTNMQVHG